MSQQLDLGTLFSDLIRYETELWNALDQRLRADLGLTLSRYEPMQVISRTRNCRVQDIADALSITVGGTSKLVDRMEADGWCARRPHPSDGRSSVLVLTTAGRRQLVRATAVVDRELQLRLAGAVSPRSLQQLAVTLRRLREAGHLIDSPNA